MPRYTLYHAPFTRSVRLLWTLRELGLPHDVVERPLHEYVVDRDFRQISLTGRVPCLVAEGGSPWVESLAIMQLLFEQHGADSPLWRPPGHAERAGLLQWLQVSETVQVHLQNLNQQLFFIRPPEARSAGTVKLELARLKLALRTIDEALAAQPFLLAGGFSAADIALGYTVAVANAFRPIDEWPRLVAYVQRLQQREAAIGVLQMPPTLPQPLL